MTITRRFVPVHDVNAVQSRLLNSLFQDFARPQVHTGTFTPAVDVYEDATTIRLTLETPGIAPEKLNLHMENNTLTISGERKAPAGQKDALQRVERRFGSFARSFTLPQTVDTENVSAHSEYGVLTIELPKKAAAQPKQIKVTVSAAEPAKTVEGAANQPAVDAEAKPAQA